MSNLRVLIAEEELGVARLLEVLMKRKGYRTSVVPDGIQAISEARDAPPDLILIDSILPIRDGLEVLDELKQDPETAEIPVVLLTTEEALELHPEPQVAHITKPFDLRGLDAVVEQALLSKVHAVS